MHGVVHVALRVPGDGEGLHAALVIGGPGPDLVVALLRQFHRLREALPGIGVGRRVQLGLNPGGAEVDLQIKPCDRVVTGPGIAAHLHRALALGQFHAGLGRGDQRLDHHAIWLYARFTLSFRDVEEMLAERGLGVSYETRTISHRFDTGWNP